MTDSLRANCKSNGFSLIEVTIVLMVISIIMAATLQTYNVYRAKKQHNETIVSLSLIQSALTRYVEKYGRYPLPADRDNAIGTANFGRSVASIPGGTNCNTDPEKACRLTGGGGPNTVYRGDVPFATLGIHYKNMMDSYGNKFTYAVTARLTDVSTFNNNDGRIQISALDGTDLYTGTTPLAHFFVFSPGADRQGAYSLNGTQVVACGAAATNGTDTENCDDDNEFRSNFDTDTTSGTFNSQVLNFADGANHFDDLSIYQNALSSALWKINGSGELFRDASSNVLIGVPETLPSSSCTVTTTSNCVVPPRVSLDVRGDGTDGVVLSDGVRLNRLCTRDQNCTDPGTSAYSAGTLKPAYYGGTAPNVSGPFNSTTQGNAGGGILCSGNRGLNGFSHSASTGHVDERCTNSANIDNSAATTFGDCITGQYAYAVNASGVILCRTP